MRYLAILLVAAACGRLPQAPRYPSVGQSHRFEDGGGLLVIGVLLPHTESRRLADLVPPEKLEAFLSGDWETKAPEPELPVEEFPYYEEDNAAARYAPLARRLGKALGVTVLFREITVEERHTVALISEPKATLLRRCRRALAKVTTFKRNPLRLVSARREKDKVFVELAETPDKAEVRDLEDWIVWSGDLAGGVDFPDGGLDPFTHRLVVHKAGLKRAWRIVDLVGTVERRLLATSKAIAGGTLAVRLSFFNTLTKARVKGERTQVAVKRSGKRLATAHVTSDELGTADVRLKIPEEVEAGPAKLVVGCKEFPISIERGRRLSVVTDRTLYQPGGTVHVRVMVHDFPSGKPSQDAEVTVKYRGRERLLKASDHGIASTEFKAERGGRAVLVKSGGASAWAEFKVQAFETPRFTITLEPPQLTLRLGESAPVLLTATYMNGSPMVGAKVSGGKTEGVTDEQGRFELTVKRTTTVYVQDVDGRSARQTLSVERPSEAELATNPQPAALVLSKRVARVGETITISREQGPFYLDVMREGVLLRTLATNDRSIELLLEKDLAGLLSLNAYTMMNNKPVGHSARVLVLRDRGLDVAAATQRDEYRPGETALVDVSVTDRRGKPSSAVLGYWAVDDALLAIAPWESGYEAVFDVLGPRLGHDLGALAEGRGSLHVLGRVKEMADPFTIHHKRTPSFEEESGKLVRTLLSSRLKRLHDLFYDIYARIPLTELWTASSLRERLRWHVQRRELDPRLLHDPWGTPLALWQGDNEYTFHWISAGPDLAWDTEDDRGVIWELTLPDRVREFYEFFEQAIDMDCPPFWGPRTNSAIGLGGGAGGGRRGRGGMRNLRAGGGTGLVEQPVHLRRDFDPTLCFVPEAVVGPTGRARLRIPLSDAITTWRMRLVASAIDGASGVGFGAIRVSQPLHVEPWLASHLTVGDELDLPVAVRNETAESVRARVQLRASSELEVIGSSDAIVAVGPHRTGAHTFRIRASRAGRARVRLDASTGAERDATERIVSIRPDAREVVEVLNNRSTFAASRLGSVRLDVYPGAVAELLAGFEGLIRKPHGCFEQTSSTLYPMVLVLDYLKRTGQSQPALEARALELIEAGYRKLLGYEVAARPGGFSLWGRAPARPLLTAYGLMEFADMARVYPVDPDLIARIVKYLKSVQREDGSWGGSFVRTAYVAWALGSAGARNERARAWLAARAGREEDAYGLALAVLAGVDATKTLVAMRDNGVWTPVGSTGFGARGRCARIETTALAIMALLPHPSASEALPRLVSWRGKSGRFGSTQSTILALKALLAAEASRSPAGPAEVAVLQEGRELGKLTVPGGALSMRSLDLGTTSAARFDVRCDMRYTLSRTSWVGWDQPRKRKGDLSLKVSYPKNALKVAQEGIVDVAVVNRGKRKARQVTAVIGVPPGCDIDTTQIRTARNVERSATAVVVYFDDFDPGKRRCFSFAITPRYALKVKTAPSKVYEYYAPDEAAVVPGVVVTTPKGSRNIK